MSKFTSPFLAKSPLSDLQSLQTKYREFKAKAGGKIRRLAGMGPNIPKRSQNKMK